MALALAAHRFAMYPPEHPSIVPASERVIRELAGLLTERRALTLAVKPRQIAVEGRSTPDNQPVISDLAQRLHDHQLGAVVFLSGTTVDEVEGFLQALGTDPERDAMALGLLPFDERPSWPHVRLYPLGYDVLETSERPRRPEDVLPVRDLWTTLARVALVLGEGGDSEDPPDPQAVARAIREGSKEPESAKQIFGALLDLTDELAWAEGEEAVQFRAKTSELIRGVAPADVERLARNGADAEGRRALLRRASRSGIEPEAVVNVVEGVSHAQGQPISSSFSRLLSKLSVHAEHGSRALRAEAESAIRSNVERLISDWELSDPNPIAYTQTLERMADWSGTVRPSEEQALDLPGAERIVKMALEVDAVGPSLTRALRDAAREGRIAKVLGYCEKARPGSKVARFIEDTLITPEQLGRLLEGDDVDEESLGMIVDRLGDLALEPLFEKLVRSESRSIRRKIFDCLTSMGERVAAKAVEHLNDPPWYVQRNMLALLQRVPSLPPGFSPLQHLRHDDPRVRREALPLAIRDSGTRESALELALEDSDERMVRMALLELQEWIPYKLVPVVVERVLEGEDFPELRSLAARALRTSGEPLAREALLRLCRGGRAGIFRRRKLPPRSPELLSALHSLAWGWDSDPDAQWALLAARKSKDPQVRAAVDGVAEVRDGTGAGRP
jgi:hypothetical protein